MERQMKCPDCNGKAFTHSSGDGWDEWDECRLCNPNGDREPDDGFTTPERIAEFRAAEAAEAARIDALIADEMRDLPNRDPHV
jgi:hypothetical protein